MKLNYTAIVTMIMQKENLQTILNTMAEYLKSSLLILSDDMDILAFSDKILPRDPRFAQAVQDGYFSSEEISQTYQHPFMKNFTRSPGISSGLTYGTDDTTLKYFILFPKTTYHYAITFVAFPLENRFEKQQQDLLHSFAALIKNTYFQSENLPMAYSFRGPKKILQKLLNQNYAQANNPEITEDITIDDTVFNNIQMLVFSLDFQKISDGGLNSYAERICAILDNDYATVYDDWIVTFFPAREITDVHIEQLLNLAKQANAEIGVSQKFSGKDQVRKHYKQAVFSINMARKMNLTDQIFYYDDMYIYALLEQCRKEDYWNNTEHPVLTQLKHYDKEHSSCLYDTMYHLLKCGMSASLTAKTMGIHKSTLHHRMEILKELIPGLLDKSTDWQASVMLSYDIARLKRAN